MTELGEIPSEWAINKIGELTEIKTGGTPSTKCEKYWKDGDIPWMASGDVNKKIINGVDGRITKSGMENSAAKLLPKDTVMIALNGQGKTKGTVAYLNIELTCNQSLAGFLPNYNVFNSKYLYYNLQSRYFEIRGLAGDGARNGLNLGLLREILIPIPSIKEQEKIALILSTLDEQIDNVDALIWENKELKKGLMQTLLTKGIGHTKFKKTEIGEIPEEWEVKELKEIVDFINGKGHEKCIDEDGKYIVVNSKFVSTEGAIKKYSNENLCPLYKEQIAIVMSDVPNGKAIAKCYYIDKDNIYTLNQRIGGLKSDKVNSRYLFYYLNRNKYFLKFDDGVKQTNLRKDEVLSCPVLIPGNKEQERIASILVEVDKKIEKYQNKKQRLEELKKGLMQQLLTGKIRVN